MNRTLTCLLYAAAAASLLFAAACTTTKSGSDKSGDDKIERVEPTRYELYLDRIEEGDTAIDFRDFRMAFTETPLYNPYKTEDLTGNGKIDQAKSALKDSNFRRAAEILDGVLALSYVDIHGHLYSIATHEGLKDVTRAGLHRSMYRGLVKSIFASGDGKTPASAFEVISTDELYYVLYLLDLETIEQSLVHHNGSAFDLMKTRSRKTGETVELYFNIDRQEMFIKQKLLPQNSKTDNPKK